MSVMEAGVFVEVIPDNDYDESTTSIQRSTKRIISSQKQSENTNSANTPEIVQVEKVVGSREKDFDVSDKYLEDVIEDEIPSKAEIALLVSNSMKIIFRQLADIDQRLKHIENKVLNEN